MNIKVNIDILNKKFGEVVAPDDKHYQTFKSWAERKDRKSGVVICEFIESVETPKPVEAPEAAPVTVEKKYTCENCGVECKTALSLYNHKKKCQEK